MAILKVADTLTQSPIRLIYSDAYSLTGKMNSLNIWGIRGSLWACLWSKCSLCQYQLHMNCFMNKLALGDGRKNN